MESSKKYNIGDTVRFTTEIGTYIKKIVFKHPILNEVDIISEDEHHQFLGIVTDDLELVEN